MRNRYLTLALISFLIAAVCGALMVMALRGQSVDVRWSNWLTNSMNELTGSRAFDCMVHVDATGGIDFWVVKNGDINMIEIGGAIGWVAGFALTEGEPYMDRLDTLYFKRATDRFSFAEITAKECLLIYALMQRGNLSDNEVYTLIQKTVKWTRGR